MSSKPQHEKSVQDAKLGHGFNSNHYGIPGARQAYDEQVRRNEQLNAALLGGLNNPQGGSSGPQYQNRRESMSLQELSLMAGFTLATVACIGFAYLPISMAFGIERTGAGSFPPVIVTMLYGWIVSGIMAFRFIRDLIKAVKERIDGWNNSRPSPNIPAMRFSGPGLVEIFRAFATSIFPVGFVLVLPIWMFQTAAAFGFSWALLLVLFPYSVLLFFRLQTEDENRLQTAIKISIPNAAAAVLGLFAGIIGLT